MALRLAALFAEAFLISDFLLQSDDSADGERTEDYRLGVEDCMRRARFRCWLASAVREKADSAAEGLPYRPKTNLKKKCVRNLTGKTQNFPTSCKKIAKFRTEKIIAQPIIPSVHRQIWRPDPKT